VHDDIRQEFLQRLITRTKKNIVVGDPLNPNTNFGALISAKHQQLVLGYIETAKQQGATLACGGSALKPQSAENGYFVEPTIFTDCHDDMDIIREEIFGPVMSVLSFTDEAEVIRRANDTHFGLAAGIFTLDIRRAHRVIHQLQAGICWINAYGNSPAQMPVGGYKMSGIGRENGAETLLQYTQIKSVYVGLNKIESPY
jgi:betaine-aldehyde dehydrogenase